MGRHQSRVEPFDRKGGLTTMLLDTYLNAVRTYLPRRADQDDIITELSAHLQIKLEEREEALGRRLTEEEQAAVLGDYGNPLVVAGRYGSTGMGLAFGRQLIGPEVFELYRRVLVGQFVLTIVVVTIVMLLGGVQGTIGRYLWPLLGQFVLSTIIFAAIDRFKRQSGTRQTWNFPPAYMQTVPRWQSMGGFVTLSVVAVWWAAIPYAPVLLLGTLADRLAFTDGWHAFYWPILSLLLAGATQRLVTFVEPGWSWLQSITRLATNGIGVALLYPFLQSAPYVTAIDAGAERIAARVNSSIWWNSWASFGLYWLVNAGFMAWLCWQHLARRRMLREQTLVQQSVRQS
jgi:hypothetical protein